MRGCSSKHVTGFHRALRCVCVVVGVPSTFRGIFYIPRFRTGQDELPDWACTSLSGWKVYLRQPLGKGPLRSPAFPTPWSNIPHKVHPVPPNRILLCCSFDMVSFPIRFLAVFSLGHFTPPAQPNAVKNNGRKELKWEISLTDDARIRRSRDLQRLSLSDPALSLAELRCGRVHAGVQQQEENKLFSLLWFMS